MPLPQRGKTMGGWVGSSTKTHVLSIEGAIADAYNQAKSRYKGKPIELKVAEIYVVGTNPITEYLVKLVPVP
ncbi:MAG: hypothetical protein ACXVZL_12325 [Gaiellaceae bacterium]